LSARNILVISADRRMSVDLIPLLSQQIPSAQVAELNSYPNRSALAEHLASRPAGLCFLDVATNRDYALTVLSDLSQLSPSMSVVVLLANNNTDLILTCLRQNASEFLLQPVTADQLLPVLERLALMRPTGNALGSGAKVITIIPVKGACGASTIASNLAFALKKAGSQKVLLGDMDPYTGTLSFLLKAKSTYTFLDALSRIGSLDAELWRGLVFTQSGIDILLAPENPMDSSLDLPDPTPVFEFCRQIYESIVVDVGNAFSSWSLHLARAADEVLLVTTNELPALRATQRVMQNFDKQHIERARVRLVVNRYSPDIGLTQEAIETALHLDVFHQLPSDYEVVQRALVEGKQIPISTAFGKSLGALASRLVGKSKTEPVDKKKGSSWGSIFSNLVSRATS